MRSLRAAILLLPLLLAWHAGAAAEALVLSPIRISAHAYYVQGEAGVASRENQGFNSNAGFVVTPDGVVVMDALGTPALGEALVQAIRRITAQPIRRVILTHYHADHFYGLQALKAAGAEIWAHAEARDYLLGDEVQRRLEQRRGDLAPWVDKDTLLVPADRWLTSDETFTLGGMQFDVIYMGPAHSPEDTIIVLRDEGVIYSGDIIFAGRIPFVGSADSKRWLAAIERLIAMRPVIMVPGHGAASRDPQADLELTRGYLSYLRQVMGQAVKDFVPFDTAYENADWSRYANLPAFEPANRINAYGTYLTMEREALEGAR